MIAREPMMSRTTPSRFSLLTREPTWTFSANDLSGTPWTRSRSYSPKPFSGGTSIWPSSPSSRPTSASSSPGMTCPLPTRTMIGPYVADGFSIPASFASAALVVSKTISSTEPV